MAKTNLRGYDREIETLIDQNNINEAIAHCKYILKLFPKHADTYRLMGKAYLETRRFSDTAVLFQKVLSVFPDDFISQIGMSIIREDEGNLDAAIWHMERAFEVQPSNSAIQDELRRLYGRRDGIQPPKVRLTRGALVRMYARGELYPQAIAEAKVALAEDPDRIDIAILLAKMHSICNQKMEAAEICNQILSKLPYCYDANQILYEILPETSQEERKVYQQRLFAINPYSAYLSPSFPTVSLVPDQSVIIERLEYSGEDVAGDQPEWAQSVGAKIDSSAKEAGDWLPDNSDQFIPSSNTALPFEPQETYPSMQSVQQNPQIEDTHPVIPVDDKDEDLIPDWMQSEGWTKTDRSADEIMSSQSDAEPEMAIPAEIPSWLKDKAPVENLASIPQIEPPQPSEDLPWLQEQTAEPQSENPVPPVWLLEEQAANTAEPVSTEDMSVVGADENQKSYSSTEFDLPSTDSDLDSGMAWLEQLAQKQHQENSMESGPELTASNIEDPLPWEENLSAPIEETAPSQQIPIPPSSDQVNPPANENLPEDEPLPDWLREIENMPVSEDKPANEIFQSFTTSSWMAENPLNPEDKMEDFPPTGASSIEQPAIEEFDEIPAWFQSTAGETKSIDSNLPVSDQQAIPESETTPFEDQTMPDSEKTAPIPDKSAEQVPEWITSQAGIDNLSPAQPVEQTAPIKTIIEDAPLDHESVNFTPDINLPSESVMEANTDADNAPPLSEMTLTDSAPLPPAPLAQAIIEPSPTNETADTTPPLYPQAEKASDLLDLARQAADSNHIQDALDHLNTLINKRGALEMVINQLMDMAYRHPVDPTIWQTLGDAYFKSNQLQAAIDAYTKAEELIR